MGRKERKLNYHKSIETESETDLPQEGSSASLANRFPLKRVSHHPPHIRLELSSSVRFRLVEVEAGRTKLSEDRMEGELLNLNEDGMLISTIHPVPDEGFLLANLILDRTVNLVGVLGRIKKVEPLDDGNLLVGVEFSTPEELGKLFSPQEISKLQIKPESLKQKLKHILNRHLLKTQLATRINK
jgi:hypothetical protein